MPSTGEASPTSRSSAALRLTQVGCVVLQRRGKLIFQGRPWGEKAVTFLKPQY